MGVKNRIHFLQIYSLIAQYTLTALMSSVDRNNTLKLKKQQTQRIYCWEGQSPEHSLWHLFISIGTVMFPCSSSTFYASGRGERQRYAEREIQRQRDRERQRQRDRSNFTVYSGFVAHWAYLCFRITLFSFIMLKLVCHVAPDQPHTVTLATERQDPYTADWECCIIGPWDHQHRK